MGDKNLHWAFGVVKKLLKDHPNKKKFTIAAGITPSGTIHIGNFRESITVDIVARALSFKGLDVRFIWSWDDFDVFRRVPNNMPDQEKLKKYLRKPITDTPDTYDCKHDSFATHNIDSFAKDLPRVGVNPEFIRQAEKYRNCDYAEEIETCLKSTADIKEILDQNRKEPLGEGWLPTSIFCERCGKDTINKQEYKGNYTVSYSCSCGHSDTFDIRKKGIIKLKWRVDWPMRWHYESLDFEPAGKDHFAAGGSRVSGVRIQEKVWGEKAPFGFMYEWIGIKGGGQFSSSSGNVVTLEDVLEIYEPAIVRWMFAGTRPNAEFCISFDTDVLKIYEDFDRCERIYFGEEVNEKEALKQKEIYEFSVVDPDKIPSKLPIQPSFRHLTTILQIKGLDVDEAVKEFDAKSESDKARLRLRAMCAKNWIQKYAPEDFKFSVQDRINITIDEAMKPIIKQVPFLLSLKKWDDSQKLHEALYNLMQSNGVAAKDFYKACYNVLIAKDKGPRLASFILEIGVDKAKNLFEKVE